ALRCGALPASVRVGQGSAIGAGLSPLARLHLGRGDRYSGLGSTDCRSARASMPFVICSTGDALAFKVAGANQTSATRDGARGKDRGPAIETQFFGVLNAYAARPGVGQPRRRSPASQPSGLY